MPRHDLVCDKCGSIRLDFSSTSFDSLTHELCGGTFEILWTASHPRDAVASATERTVVWENPLTGEVRYPGRNDAPIPARYRDQGYVRRELSSLREVEKFEKSHGVRNQAAWYDRGSGRDDFGD